MDKPARTVAKTRAARTLLGVLLLALSNGLVPAPAAAGPRLDREEREQLRQELRRQSRDERRQGWPADDAGRPAPRDDGWAAGRQWNAPRRQDGPRDWNGPRDGNGPRRWDGPRDWNGSRGWDGERPPRDERHRMAPEDREQLRHMLREHRRGRRD